MTDDWEWSMTTRTHRAGSGRIAPLRASGLRLFAHAPSRPQIVCRDTPVVPRRTDMFSTGNTPGTES